MFLFGTKRKEESYFTSNHEDNIKYVDEIYYYIVPNELADQQRTYITCYDCIKVTICGKFTANGWGILLAYSYCDVFVLSSMISW